MAVFASSTVAPTVVSTSKAIVNIGGTDMIALQVRVEFSRNVEIIQSLGGERRVVSIAEPQGRLTCGAVLMDKIPSEIENNGCTPFTCTVTFKEGCAIKDKTITCHGCIVQGVTFSAQGGRGYVGQDLQIVFTGLDV